MLSIVIVAAWLLGGPSLCTSNANAVFMQMIDSRKADYNDQQIPDDEWYSLPRQTLGLKEFKPFARIYNNPTLYTACAREYLRDKTRSHRSKHFVVLSMEKLPFKGCLDMLELCYSLYKSGLIHEETLSEALVPAFSDSKIFTKNKSNPAIVSILKKMAADKTLPSYMHGSIARKLH